MSGSAKVIGSIDVGSIFEEVEAKPKGYHSVQEIAKVTGRAAVTVGARMRALRLRGEVDSVRAMSGGHYSWVYRVKL